MGKLYIFTLFESDGGRPQCTGVRIGDNVQIYDLFRPHKPIAPIFDARDTIKNLIIAANRQGHQIITSDFKGHLAAFRLPLDDRTYNVYDMHLPDIKSTGTLARDTEVLKKILDKLVIRKPRPYHKIYANAAVVYHDLQQRGIWNNYCLERPIWSQKTFSGRSKTSGFNIQGFSDKTFLAPPGTNSHSVLIHFDWISADIRVAALLSGDQQLEQAFATTDPYTHMMEQINKDADTPITRDECKLFLLKSINSMDFTSVALTQIYPDLGRWIGRCQRLINEPNGYLETVLGRRFRLAHAKNQLAVLNGVMQGSVAHGMQLVVRRLWERLGHRLVTEVHDSLVVVADADSQAIKATITTVVPIMSQPFVDVLPTNPMFPLKISIGKVWRKWKLAAICRASGLEYVKTQPQTAPDATAGGEATSSPPTAITAAG